jgi:hypothetical protein
MALLAITGSRCTFRIEQFLMLVTGCSIAIEIPSAVMTDATTQSQCPWSLNEGLLLAHTGVVPTCELVYLLDRYTALPLYS